MTYVLQQCDTYRQTVVQQGAAGAVVVNRVMDRPVEVVSKGPKGDRGDAGLQGPPGPTGGTAVERTAGTALGGHRVVRSAGGISVAYASCTQAEHGDDVLGVTLGAAALGAPVLVQTQGELDEPSWSWTPDEPVFLGEDGGLTQEPPAGVDTKFLLVLGFAASSTRLVIRIGAAIYLED